MKESVKLSLFFIQDRLFLKKSQIRQPRMDREFLNNTRHSGFKYAPCLPPVSCLACHDLCIPARKEEKNLSLTKGISWSPHSSVQYHWLEYRILAIFSIMRSWEVNSTPPDTLVSESEFPLYLSLSSLWFPPHSCHLTSLLLFSLPPCWTEVLIQGFPMPENTLPRSYTPSPRMAFLVHHT